MSKRQLLSSSKTPIKGVEGQGYSQEREDGIKHILKKRLRFCFLIWVVDRCGWLFHGCQLVSSLPQMRFTFLAPISTQLFCIDKQLFSAVLEPVSRGHHSSLVAHWLLVSGDQGSNPGGWVKFSLFRVLVVITFLWLILELITKMRYHSCSMICT